MAYQSIEILVLILRKNFLTGILISFIISPYLIGQDVSGNLEGRIIDSAGTPIVGVNILIESKSLMGTKGSSTNQTGYFQILSLPVGEYQLKITAIGYRQLNMVHIQIELGKTTSLGEIVLIEEAINLPEVTVSGKKPIIDPSSTSYGGNINSSVFEDLPVDRNYVNIAALLPSANISYYGDATNIGGGTGFENKYFVDGVEVTDPLIGRDGTKLPYNFIQEVEVKIGGYDVDSRSSLGGIINVITFSGSNEFHGSVFGFYTSNRLASNQQLGTLDVTQGDFTNYDIGVSLGGPIVLDQLWFFAAYNPTFYNRDVEVPSFGTYVDQTMTNSFAGKLSWKASSNLSIDFTITGDPTERDAVGRGVNVPPSSLTNPDPYLQSIVEGGVNYSLNGTYTIGKDISLFGLLSRVDRHDTGEGETSVGKSEVFYNDILESTWSGGVQSNWDSYRSSTVGRVSGNFLLSSHNLNVGIEYKTNMADNNYNNHSIVRFDTSYYREYISSGFGEVKNQIPSVYIQDSWRIFENLNIKGGIKWDGHYIIGSNNEVVQTITVPLQPRIGFVFMLNKNNDQRIYGSFGRFQQEFSLFPSVDLHSENGYYLGIEYYHDPRENSNGGDTLYYGQSSIIPEVPDLQAQYYDEFSLGYERLIGWNIKIGVQGVYRTLRQAIDDIWYQENGEWFYGFGNPGSGMLAEWPKAERDYTALVLTIQRTNDKYFNFLASYVLSRNYGNYEGLFDASYHSQFPNRNNISSIRKYY